MVFCMYHHLREICALLTIPDNPFVKRESFSPRTLVAYQLLSVISWAVVVVFGIYYSVKTPDDVKHAHLIWRQAERFDTPFSQNIYLTGIFW